MWISHVCSHWRGVALECPSLWAVIPFSHLEWAEEMLERAKLAPLTVVADVSSVNSRKNGLIKATLARMSQIQALSLCQQQGYHTPMGTIVRGFVSPAPLLERLSLSFENSLDIHVPLKDLFCGQAPRLRELELRYCSFFWNSPLFGGLTTFSVYRVTPPAPMSEVMAALSNMPNLMILDLHDALPILANTTSGGGVERTVSLPNLIHIYVQSFVPECVFLLNHLTYPPAVFITLVCNVKLFRFNDPQDISSRKLSIQGLGAILCNSRHIRCLKAKFPSDFACRLLLSDIPGTCSGYPTDTSQTDVTLQFKLEGPCFRDQVERAKLYILQILWASIAVENLESLHVIHESYLHGIWSNIFDSLAAAKLKRLRVVDSSGLDFLQEFSPDALAPQEEEFQQPIPLRFSSLQQLAIVGWDFDQIVDQGVTKCFDLLMICLKDRQNRHAGIRELFLNKRHRTTGQYVEQLEQIVDNVYWDRCENVNFDNDEDVILGSDSEDSDDPDAGYFVY